MSKQKPKPLQPEFDTKIRIPAISPVPPSIAEKPLGRDLNARIFLKSVSFNRPMAPFGHAYDLVEAEGYTLELIAGARFIRVSKKDRYVATVNMASVVSFVE